MTTNQIWAAIAKYKNLLVGNDIPIKQYPKDQPLIDADPELAVDTDILAHCHTMLIQMERLLEQGKIEKAFRWLGFVQGCLWCTGLYTIDDMREDNR